MSKTPLDIAHAEMEMAPEQETARLRFFERLADSELYLLLRSEPTSDVLEPEIFPTEDGDFALIFDRADRIAEFCGGEAFHAVMPGRTIAQLLDGKDIGLGINLDVSTSSTLLPAEAISWLARTLRNRPNEVAAEPEELFAPVGLPDNLLQGLDTKLAAAGGLAKLAYLVKVIHKGGRSGHMLALIDPVPGAEEALVAAIGEALIFSGLEAGELDIAFFDASDAISAKLAKVGLRFDLPEPAEAKAPIAPGMHPTIPPRLR